MAQVVNISIDRGSKFQYVFQLANTAGIDLTTSIPKAYLTPEYDEANLAISFTSEIIGSNVVISLTDTQTSNLVSTYSLPGSAETWVFDVVVVDASNSATRVVEGRAHINPRVTPFP